MAAGEPPPSPGLRRGTRERHDALLGLLRGGTTQVEDLAAAVGVSASTVRRDLRRLDRQGEVARTYGGALVPGAFHERGVDERAGLRSEAKAAIAVRALLLVPEGATVFLDAGSTCGALARLLVDRVGLTVVTRGLEVALELTGRGEVEVVMLGGRVRRMSHGLVGPLTDLAMDRLVVDVAFLGADAVHPRDGVGEPTLEEATVKERVAQRARRVVVLADASKLAGEPVPAWARLPGGWTLVTDAAAPATVRRAFERAGVEVLLPLDPSPTP